MNCANNADEAIEHQIWPLEFEPDDAESLMSDDLVSLDGTSTSTDDSWIWVFGSHEPDDELNDSHGPNAKSSESDFDFEDWLE